MAEYTLRVYHAISTKMFAALIEIPVKGSTLRLGSEKNVSPHTAIVVPSDGHISQLRDDLLI